MADKHLPETIEDDRGMLARREGQPPATRTALVHVTPDQLELLDKIRITGLEVFANHGVYAEENKLGQKFVVSLTLYTDLRRAGETDDLEASIDYGAVAHKVDEYLRAHTFKLIEAAAEGVAGMLLHEWSALFGVRVRIEKPWAPIGLPMEGGVSVEIERLR